MNLIKSIGIPILFLFVLLSSCEKIENNYNSNEDGDGIFRGTEVSSNPTEIVPFETVKNQFNRGDKLKLRLNREKYKIEEFDIVFEASYEDFDDRLIICHTPDELIIGKGDSGSPILTQDGKVVAILCYGFNGNKNQFAARTIEDVVGIGSNIEQYAQIKSSSLFLKEKVEPIRFISGMSEELFNRHFNKEPLKSKNAPFHFIETNNMESEQNNGQDNINVIPGSSFSIMEVCGDVFKIGATGTVSYLDNDNMYGFGHGFYGADYAKSMPAYPAEMKTMIETTEYAFKLSLASDSLIGSLVVDNYNGVLIDKKKKPAVFEIQTSIKIASQDAIVNNHKVAQFNDPYEEEYYTRNIIPSLVYYHVSDNKDIKMVDYCTGTGKIIIEFENIETIIHEFQVYDNAYYIDFEVYYMVSDLFYNIEDNIKDVKFSIDINKTEPF